jgi:hypothetical protein
MKFYRCVIMSKHNYIFFFRRWEQIWGRIPLPSENPHQQWRN